MLIKADVCVIGAGSGGLSAAVGAAQMGASTVLVEGAKMGGDCLNYGCVPSKSLLAAAKVSHQAKTMQRLGLKCGTFKIDHGGVYDYIQKVIDTIAPHDSVERMESLGIRVFRQTGYFISRKKLQVGEDIIRAKRFIIATGSTPAIPVIPGLRNRDKVPYFTNETIFKVQAHIKHLIIIGGGPIGIEMAQAHVRLGSQVTLIQRSHIMHRDDEEAVAVIRERLQHEGVVLLEDSEIKKLEKVDGSITVTVAKEGKQKTITGSHILVAAGRRPNLDSLRLGAAGVVYSSEGIKVNQRLRTSNRRIYALGDVIGQALFTHMANYHAGIVLRNILFGLRSKAKTSAMPWVTYTDPELAQVGMTEVIARQQYKNGLRILRFDFSENDRAQTEHATQGLIKVVATKRGKVLGVTIVGAHAGELVLPWSLAITQGLKVGAIASSIVPYPTYSEVSKRVAGSFFTPTLFSNRVRRVVRFLMHFR